jgi:hypothetical protein
VEQHARAVGMLRTRTRARVVVGAIFDPRPAWRWRVAAWPSRFPRSAGRAM